MSDSRDMHSGNPINEGLDPRFDSEHRQAQHADRTSAAVIEADGREVQDDLYDDAAHAARPEQPSLLREWGPLLAGAVVFALIFRLFLFQAYSIPSTSMLPGLEVDDRVLVNKLSYRAHEVNRGDTVVFERPPNTVGPHDVLIKRVIGLPGETIELINGDIYVDGLRVEESYTVAPHETWPLTGMPNCIDGSSTKCTIPADHVLVFGDNRMRSTDGRSFGPIPIDTIVGRAFVKFWPLSDAGLL